MMKILGKLPLNSHGFRLKINNYKKLNKKFELFLIDA